MFPLKNLAHKGLIYVSKRDPSHITSVAESLWISKRIRMGLSHEHYADLNFIYASQTTDTNINNREMSANLWNNCV